MKWTTDLKIMFSSLNMVNMFSYLKFAVLFAFLFYTSWKLLDPTLIPTAHAISPGEAAPTSVECGAPNEVVELDADGNPIKPKKEYHVVDFEEAPIASFMIAVMGPICIIYWVWWIYDHSNWK